MAKIDVDGIYSELRKMEVSLKEQTHANHHYYQKILTKCDLYVSVISKYFAEVKQSCSKLQVEHNIKSSEIEIRRRHHIAENEEIQRRYSTGREREMAVEVILKDDIAEQKQMENRLILLKDLAQVLSTFLAVMRERKRDAKEQWKLLCEQSRAANLADPDDKSVQELQKVLGHLEQTAADSGFNDDLTVDDDIVSEEYIEGSEETDEEALQAIETDPTEISVNESVDISTDDEIEIDPGLTGPIDQTHEDAGVESDTDITASENSTGELESVDEGPDILDMLPTEGSKAEEDSSAEDQEVSKKPEEIKEPTEELPQPEPEEGNNEEMGLEDDLLADLDEIDEGILAGIESVEKPGKTGKAGRESKSKEAPKDDAVVTDIPPNQDETDGERGGEPTSEEATTDDVDISGSDKAPPKATETEGQGDIELEEPVRKEDAASVSTDVDIDDILGELDGL